MYRRIDIVQSWCRIIHSEQVERWTCTSLAKVLNERCRSVARIAFWFSRESAYWSWGKSISKNSISQKDEFQPHKKCGRWFKVVMPHKAPIFPLRATLRWRDTHIAKDGKFCQNSSTAKKKVTRKGVYIIPKNWPKLYTTGKSVYIVAKKWPTWVFWVIFSRKIDALSGVICPISAYASCG